MTAALGHFPADDDLRPIELARVPDLAAELGAHPVVIDPNSTQLGLLLAPLAPGS